MRIDVGGDVRQRHAGWSPHVDAWAVGDPAGGGAAEP